MPSEGKRPPATTTPPRTRPGPAPRPAAHTPAAPAKTTGRLTQSQQQTTPTKPFIPSRSDTLGSTVEYAKDWAVGKRPYLKYAFANPYNLTLLAGGLAASALTLNPFLAIATLGLEGLWLLHAPESKLLQKLLWDPQYEKARLAMEEQALRQRIGSLVDRKRERVERLVARQQDIQRIAAQNPSFTGELLRGELMKTRRLVDAFIEMSVTCARYEEYLSSVNSAELERDHRRWETVVSQAEENTPQAQIARKNLAIIEKRAEKLQEIRNYLTIAYGQLDLIENSFQLIADQIVTMQSPQQLSGQLDELLDGVESIKQTAIDTERLLGGL